MKNVVAALIITMVLGVSYADTPVNRADVVMGLLERLVCDIEDNFDETNEEQDVDWVSWTQEGFFGEMSTNQTEQILYRKAFDAVLENFGFSSVLEQLWRKKRCWNQSKRLCSLDNETELQDCDSHL